MNLPQDAFLGENPGIELLDGSPRRHLFQRIQVVVFFQVKRVNIDSDIVHFDKLNGLNCSLKVERLFLCCDVLQTSIIHF